MRCMVCHAPQMKDASEKLVQEVAGLIITAAEEKSEQEKNAALASLSKLNVNCIICHNTRAVIETHAQGPAEKGVYYGPTGTPTTDHGVKKSTTITSSLFCGQCHRTYIPPDGEILFCTSLYESFQDNYRSRGGTQGCQDCHMRAKEKGHRMPGSHDPTLLKEALVLDASARGVRMQPGKWLPSAEVEVTLTDYAGHRTPDG